MKVSNGDKVIYVDIDNCVLEIGVCSEVNHDEDEMILTKYDGSTISPLSAQSEDKVTEISVISDRAYFNIAGMHNHCIETGFYDEKLMVELDA